MKTRGRGFSLIELLVSAAILTVAILLIVGIFTMLFDASAKTVDLTAGTVLAESLMSQQVQELTLQPSNSQLFFQYNYTTPQPLSGGTYALNTATYYYKLYVEDVATDPTMYLHSTMDYGTPAHTNLKRLDMELWWWDGAAGSAGNLNNMTIHTSHSGAGKLQVHMSRLLWPTANY